nr:hypothetical protein [uncultured Mediterranean phage uvMED]
MTRAQEIADLLSGVTISTADNTAQLVLKSTDADASVGPVLNLSRDNSSAADNDLVGEVQFNADDDGNNQTTYGKILTVIEDASNGSEDGLMQIHTNVAGTLRDRIKITSSEVVLNEESIDSDFRVEGNGNANLLFVDAGNDSVGIGTNTPETFIDQVSGSIDVGLAIAGSFPSLVLNDTDVSGDDGTFGISKAGQSTTINNLGAGSIKFFNNGAQRMVINNSGNIGIGTDTITDTSNYRNIHIEGTTGTIMRFMANGTQVGQIQSDTNEFQINAVTDDPIIFKTNNTERMRITSGGLAIGGTGSANTLDDYEEGSHTATVTGSSSGSLTLNSSYNTLAYTKIGRLVTVTGLLLASSVSSGTGYTKISLPFAVSSSLFGRTASATFFNSSSANARDFVAFTVQGESFLRVYLGDATAGQSDSFQTISAASTDMYVNLTYTTD